jgi:archaellum component FlaC
MLQAMVQRVLDGQHRHDQDFADLKERLTAVELGLAAVRKDVGALTEADARMQASIDRLSDRVTRIERRLDLVNGSPS